MPPPGSGCSGSATRAPKNCSEPTNRAGISLPSTVSTMRDSRAVSAGESEAGDQHLAVFHADCDAVRLIAVLAPSLIMCGESGQRLLRLEPDADRVEVLLQHGFEFRQLSAVFGGGDLLPGRRNRLGRSGSDIEPVIHRQRGDFALLVDDEHVGSRFDVSFPVPEVADDRRRSPRSGKRMLDSGLFAAGEAEPFPFRFRVERQRNDARNRRCRFQQYALLSRIVGDDLRRITLAAEYEVERLDPFGERADIRRDELVRRDGVTRHLERPLVFDQAVGRTGVHAPAARTIVLDREFRSFAVLVRPEEIFHVDQGRRELVEQFYAQLPQLRRVGSFFRFGGGGGECAGKQDRQEHISAFFHFLTPSRNRWKSP